MILLVRDVARGNISFNIKKNRDCQESLHAATFSKIENYSLLKYIIIYEKSYNKHLFKKNIFSHENQEMALSFLDCLKRKQNLSCVF